MSSIIKIAYDMLEYVGGRVELESDNMRLTMEHGIKPPHYLGKKWIEPNTLTIEILKKSRMLKIRMIEDINDKGGIITLKSESLPENKNLSFNIDNYKEAEKVFMDFLDRYANQINNASLVIYSGGIKTFYPDIFTNKIMLRDFIIRLFYLLTDSVR